MTAPIRSMASREDAAMIFRSTVNWIMTWIAFQPLDLLTNRVHPMGYRGGRNRNCHVCGRNFAGKRVPYGSDSVTASPPRSCPGANFLRLCRQVRRLPHYPMADIRRWDSCPLTHVGQRTVGTASPPVRKAPLTPPIPSAHPFTSLLLDTRPPLGIVPPFQSITAM